MKTIECEIISGYRNFPIAVLGPRSLRIEDDWWILDCDEVEAWQFVSTRILSLQAIFDAKLSKRWGRLVACRQAFSEHWQETDGEPKGVIVTRKVGVVIHA